MTSPTEGKMFSVWRSAAHIHAGDSGNWFNNLEMQFQLNLFFFISVSPLLCYCDLSHAVSLTRGNRNVIIPHSSVIEKAVSSLVVSFYLGGLVLCLPWVKVDYLFSFSVLLLWLWLLRAEAKRGFEVTLDYNMHKFSYFYLLNIKDWQSTLLQHHLRLA